MKTDSDLFADLFDRSELVDVYYEGICIDRAPAAQSLKRFVSGDLFAAPLPELLFFLFPQCQDWYVKQWCRRGAVDAWAWDEVRGLLNRMVAGYYLIPRPFVRFALVPRPPERPGPKRYRERDARLWGLMEGFLDHGCPVEDLWEIYRLAFPPRPGLRDPRDSFRKLCARGSPWIDGPFDQKVDWHRDGDPGDFIVAPELPGDEAWADPATTVAELLGGPRPIPALALVRHFWSEHWHEHRVCSWCSLGAEHAWFWDELRGWLDWMIFTERQISPPLREFALCPRPKNPSHRPPESASYLRAAVLAQRLEEIGYTEGEEVQILVDGWPDLIDESTVRRQVNAGRDLFMDFLRMQLGASAIPFP